MFGWLVFPSELNLYRHQLIVLRELNFAYSASFDRSGETQLPQKLLENCQFAKVTKFDYCKNLEILNHEKISLQKLTILYIY